MAARRAVRAATCAAAVAAGALLAAPPAPAQQTRPAPTLNLYGTAGLIDMPVGQSLPDGTFNIAISHFAGITRTTLSFQITPRLSGSFRYAAIRNWDFGGFSTYYDRSFDLRFRILDETRYLPAVTIGLQDFAGSGVYSGEYIAATKQLTDRLRVTAGLGWGRLGSFGDIGTPFGDRPPPPADGIGGRPNWNSWFRGPVAPFGGLEWQLTDRLGVKVEYSSDRYATEDLARGVFERRSPWNFGIEYQANPLLRLGLYHLYGSEIGFSAQIAFNPAVRPLAPGVMGPAPPPVVPRPDPAADPDAWSPSWTAQTDAAVLLRDGVAQRLEREGIRLESFAVTGSSVQIRIRNLRYDAEAQAVGRTARVLANSLPASVETFEIVPVANGIPLSAVTLRRSDIEAFENAPDGAARLRAVAAIGEAGPLAPGALFGKGAYPRFSWSLGPYVRTALFNARNPVRFDVGARLSARYEIAPGLILSGAVTQRAFGNTGDVRDPSPSPLPPVRTSTYLYNRNEHPSIETLTLAWYARPARDLYARLTVGLLERMYGGVSGELLWKPVDSRLAFGVELNYARQRDYDQLFTFREYETVTGHVSAYYDLGNGFHAQLDAGRYLAGDWGATLTLDREFANGWRVGAFATLTDVSPEAFGEGAFDKGIRLTIPLNWMLGTPSRDAFNVTLRPLLRDGGAKLFVEGRLYESIRDYHLHSLDQQWERFWR